MPWVYKVIYGEPVLNEVEVALKKGGYFAAIHEADDQGHRPPRCRTARAEYVKFIPPDEPKQSRTRPSAPAADDGEDSTESGG